MNHLKVWLTLVLSNYIERIEAFTHIQNEKSKNLLVKNGFKIIEDRKDNDDLSNIVFEIRKSK